MREKTKGNARATTFRMKTETYALYAEAAAALGMDLSALLNATLGLSLPVLRDMLESRRATLERLRESLPQRREAA